MLSPEHDAALKRFGDFWLQRIVARTQIETPLQTLYHYTPDLNGVSGVLATCRMRFADIRCLNDRVELTYGLRLFRKIVRQECNIKNGVVRHFLKPMRDAGFVKRLFEHYHFYSASFGRADSRHMWNAYARGGKGFAIGVDASVFGQGGDRATIAYDEQYFTGQLRYQQTKVRRLHKEAVQFATGLVKEVSPEPEFLHKLEVEVLVDVLTTSLTSKEWKWSPEDEHRLFVIENTKGTPLRKVYRPGRPYIEMAIPKKAFVEVMLGSNVTSSDRAAVAQALADNSHTAKITLSRT